MLVIPSESGILSGLEKGRVAEVIVKDELYTSIKWLDTEEISNGHYHHRFVEYTGVIELAFSQGVVLEYQGTSELLLFKDITTLKDYGDNTTQIKQLWFNWLKEASCSELAILY